MRQLHGVVYPQLAPPPGGPAYDPPPDPDDEFAMARNHVRSAFDPPLPDAFATWLMDLHKHLRDGHHPDDRVTVPDEIIALGFTFPDATPHTNGRYTLSFADALRVFGRDDLIFRDEHPASPGAVRPPRGGVTALVAALIARGIRTTTTLHRNEATCTVALTDEQAGQLADLLLPQEGTTEDALGRALLVLDHFVHRPRPADCQLDHHGHCQEHHDNMINGRFAQPEGYELLVEHGIRESR